MTDVAIDPFLENIPRPYSRPLRILGADVLVRSNELRLLDLVDEAFAHLPRHDFVSAVPRMRVDLFWTDDADCDRYREPPRLRFFSGADLIVGSFDASNFAAISVPRASALISAGANMFEHRYELRYELIEFAFLTLASRAQGLVPLHAACVGVEDRGLLLNGRSRSGKSTLSLACMLQGFSYLSDDAVFLTPTDLFATGCSNYLHISEDAVRLIPDAGWTDSILGSPKIQRRSGAWKLEVDVRRGPFELAKRPLKIAAVVFLSSRSLDTGELLTELPPDEALAMLEEDQAYAKGLPEWTRFRQALGDVPAYRLDRPPHPNWSAEALHELLASGRG